MALSDLIITPSITTCFPDTTLSVLGYTLRHRHVLLALSSHRWVQFRWGSIFDSAVEHHPSKMAPPPGPITSEMDPWVQSQWGSNSDMTGVWEAVVQQILNSLASEMEATSMIPALSRIMTLMIMTPPYPLKVFAVKTFKLSQIGPKPRNSPKFLPTTAFR